MLCDLHVSEDLVKHNNQILQNWEMDGKQIWFAPAFRARLLDFNGTLYLRTTVAGISEKSDKQIIVRTYYCYYELC